MPRRSRKTRRGLGAFVKQKPGASSRAGREAHALAQRTGKRAYWCLDKQRGGYVVDTKPHGASCSSWAPAGLGRAPRKKKSDCGCG